MIQRNPSHILTEVIFVANQLMPVFLLLVDHAIVVCNLSLHTYIYSMQNQYIFMAETHMIRAAREGVKEEVEGREGRRNACWWQG